MYHPLAGFNPVKKYDRHTWESSPILGVKITHINSKPPLPALWTNKNLLLGICIFDADGKSSKNILSQKGGIPWDPNPQKNHQTKQVQPWPPWRTWMVYVPNHSSSPSSTGVSSSKTNLTGFGFSFFYRGYINPLNGKTIRGWYYGCTMSIWEVRV